MHNFPEVSNEAIDLTAHISKHELRIPPGTLVFLNLIHEGQGYIASISPNEVIAEKCDIYGSSPDLVTRFIRNQVFRNPGCVISPSPSAQRLVHAAIVDNPDGYDINDIVRLHFREVTHLTPIVKDLLTSENADSDPDEHDTTVQDIVDETDDLDEMENLATQVNADIEDLEKNDTFLSGILDQLASEDERDEKPDHAGQLAHDAESLEHNDLQKPDTTDSPALTDNITDQLDGSELSISEALALLDKFSDSRKKEHFEQLDKPYHANDPEESSSSVEKEGAEPPSEDLTSSSGNQHVFSCEYHIKLAEIFNILTRMSKVVEDSEANDMESFVALIDQLHHAFGLSRLPGQDMPGPSSDALLVEAIGRYRAMCFFHHQRSALD